MKLFAQTALFLGVGIFLGLVFPEIPPYFEWVGYIYLKLIKFTSIPLIFFSIVAAISALESNSFSLLPRFFCFSLLITLVAILTSLSTICLLDIASIRALFSGTLSFEKNLFVGFVHIFRKMTPENLVGSFLEDNLMQIVFISFLIALGLRKMGEDSKVLIQFFHAGRSLFFKIATFVIKISPFGIASLVANAISQDKALLFSTGSAIIFSVFCAYFTFYFVLLALVFLFKRQYARDFFKYSLAFQLEAFVAGSSKMALPTALKTMTDKIGTSEKNTHFLLPITSITNMQGLCIYLIIGSAIFINLSGRAFVLNDLMILSLFSILASIGAAGINGGALFIFPSLLALLNIPLEYIVIINAIDPLINGVRSALNITGDAVITLLVDNPTNTRERLRCFRKNSA